MNVTMHLRPAALALLTATVLLPLSAAAQQPWHEPTAQPASHPTFRLELLKPDFHSFFDEEDEGYSALTGVLFVGADVPFSDRVTARLELPIARAGYTERRYNPAGGPPIRSERSTTKIGNPYLGVTTFQPEAGITADFGVRLPFAGSGGFDERLPLSIGAASDVNRIEAFVPEALSLLGQLEHGRRLPSNLLYGLRGGVTAIRVTGYDDIDAYLPYGARLGYDDLRLRFTAGIVGQMFATGNFDEFRDRFTHQLAVETAFRLGRVRPELHIRLPLSDNLSSLNAVYGLTLAVDLR